MSTTQRPVLPENLVEAVTTLGSYDTPLDGCIRVVFTRQPLGPWTYYIGQCVLAGGVGPDTTEVYRNFAFVSKSIHQGTIKRLLDALAGAGIEMPQGLPPIRLPKTPPNWNEEIIPSHVTLARMAFRRFTASIESNAFFPDSQLLDYTLPYRPSAAAYVKEFLGFKAFHDTSDARRGELAIELPDRRGAIRFSGGLICITNPTTPLRLVGTLNGKVPVDVRNDGYVDYDECSAQHIELWLVTEESEIVDFISSTHWPHKYETATPESQREERLLQLIRRGEGEACEFKPYVDLNGSKAVELEKTVCALSNQRGGTLFIGVNDEGDIVGLARDIAKRGDEFEKALVKYEKDVRIRLRESLKDNRCFDLDVVNVSGTPLIVVEVQQARDVNYLVKSELAQTAYTRHGATSVKMSPPEIKAKSEGDAQSVLRHQIFGP
jgi:hypothetical protein